MPDKAWKAFERRVAKYFGAARNALSGGNSKVTRSDSLHNELFIECKQREKFAAITLWKGTRKLAKKEKKIPVVCLSEKGKKGFWVLCHSNDLVAVAALVNE